MNSKMKVNTTVDHPEMQHRHASNEGEYMSVSNEKVQQWKEIKD